MGVACVIGAGWAFGVWRPIRRAIGLIFRRIEIVPDRRLRVPIARIDEINPTEIGIDAAAQTILPGGDIPQYVPREADGPLLAAVSDALNGTGRWLVAVVGQSKVGKSRALFEALRATARDVDLDLVAPVDGDALRSLLTPGAVPKRTGAHVVLWLDDLEPFLDQAVTTQVLRGWHELTNGGIVVGTFGGKRGATGVGVGPETPAAIADDVLQHAREVMLDSTTPRELASLKSQLPTGVLEAIEAYGLAAYVVAGPLLARKLATGRVGGDAPSPAGVAIVRAVADWARCGRTDAMPGETLRKLWTAYLQSGTATTEATFAAGLEWALQPVAGAIALLHDIGGYDPMTTLYG